MGQFDPKINTDPALRAAGTIGKIIGKSFY
jgi:hypothetical protein